jgi:DNA repair exonuclease SbcCD nuclease subunit
LDWSSDERGLPLSSDALLAADYDYTALGHFHSQRQIKKGRNTIVYPGIVEGKGFSDPGAGQLTVVEFFDGTAHTRFIPWSVPPCQVRQVDVNNLETSADLDQLLTSWADPELLIRVELQGSAGWLVDREQLLGRHGSRFYHLEIVDDSLYLADELLSAWASEATVRGMFVRRLLDRLPYANEPAERQLLQLALRRGVAAFLERGN